MKTPAPHPHAEFIAEAIKDTSRKIEGKHRDDGFEPSNLSHVISCAESWTFRFADTVKPVIVSSLSADELWEMIRSESSILKSARKIADAAATRAIEDLQVLGCSMSGWDTFGISNIFHKQDVDTSFEYVAAMVIDDYINKVKAGKK